MRYNYVEPVREPPPWARQAGAPTPAGRVLKRSSVIGDSEGAVPSEARTLIRAARDARPQWTFRLTHSVTLNEAGNSAIHHVFLRVYGRNGEPLGYCGWTAGHTIGGHIWREHVEAGTTYRMVGVTEFAAWVKNEPYTPYAPPPQGGCPRCAVTDVRVKTDGSPYKHKDPELGAECVWRIPLKWESV